MPTLLRLLEWTEMMHVQFLVACHIVSTHLVLFIVFVYQTLG